MSELKWVKTTFGELKAGDVATKEEQGAKDFVAYWNKKDVCYIYGWAYFVRTPFPCDESDRNTPVYKIVFPSPEREALEESVRAYIGFVKGITDTAEQTLRESGRWPTPMAVWSAEGDELLKAMAEALEGK